MDTAEQTHLPKPKLYARAHKWLWMLIGAEIVVFIVAAFFRNDAAHVVVNVIYCLFILQIALSIVGLIAAAIGRSAVAYSYLGVCVSTIVLIVGVIVALAWGLH